MLKKIYNIYIKLITFVFSFLNKVYIKLLKVEVKGTYEIRGRLFLKNSGKLIFGDNLLINSGFKYNPIGGQVFTSIVVEKTGILEIKENVGISNSSIYCKSKIVIEQDVLIGGNCKIYDTDFHSIYVKDRKNKPETGVNCARVLIKSGVFIGFGSIVLKGVIIGKNSVIAAGSIVSRNIPENEIWGGNPIKFIKKIEN